MKTVLFVPGFQEDIHSRDYSAVIRAVEKRGYHVTFVPINWWRTTIDHWVDELDTIYDQHDPQDTILAGFSYGAMTAFVSAAKRSPSELWLFSLSPYFAEDLKSKNMKPTWLKEIGHRRVEAFSKLSFNKLVKDIDCRTLLVTGGIEIAKFPIIKERAAQAQRLLPQNTAVVVASAGHDVTNEAYISAVARNI